MNRNILTALTLAATLTSLVLPTGIAAAQSTTPPAPSVIAGGNPDPGVVSGSNPDPQIILSILLTGIAIS